VITSTRCPRNADGSVRKWRRLLDNQARQSIGPQRGGRKPPSITLGDG
jgi:hypothetical protein